MTALRPASADALGLTRRASLTAFTLYALLAEARAEEGVRISVDRWIEAQDEIARALAAGQITPLVWMGEVERLAHEVDVAELMGAVNASRLRAAPHGSPNDPVKRNVAFIDAAGQPRQLHYGAALFAFEPHNVITPHGHRNMVSAHLVVQGAFRVRNFDRLRDEGEAMVIRPTRDYVAELGHVSTMSSPRDNIHWFVPHGGPAMTFDVVISGLDPALPDYEIRAIDPLGGRRLADGAIVAPIMSFSASSERYTADI